MIPVHPSRHLLRAKDLVDARYREPLDVKALARAAKLSPAHFGRGFRREFGSRRPIPADAPARTCPRAVTERVAQSRHLPHDRAPERQLVPRELPGTSGMTPTQYRAAHPPARTRVYVATCVLMAPARLDTARLEKTGEQALAGVASE